MLEGSIQVINFSTRDFQASIDITRLVKVVAIPNLTPAPVGHHYIVGLMNVAGSVVPVIDLSRRFNLSDPLKYDLNTPVLICKTSTQQIFGLIVDNVVDIAEVSHEMIQSDLSCHIRNEHITGAIKYERGISLLINIDRLLEETSM